MHAQTHLCTAQVYYFRRGSVKLANRTYQNVRSDYIIHMDSGSACCSSNFVISYELYAGRKPVGGKAIKAGMRAMQVGY